jgi:hypothetical protein
MFQGPSKHGMHSFVGCSMWTKEEEFDHIYFQIPPNVNEDEFTAVFSSGGVMSQAVELNSKCALTVHPKIGLKACREYGLLCCSINVNSLHRTTSVLTCHSWPHHNRENCSPELPIRNNHLCSDRYEYSKGFRDSSKSTQSPSASAHETNC